jgi:hypothetical protein
VLHRGITDDSTPDAGNIVRIPAVNPAQPSVRSTFDRRFDRSIIGRAVIRNNENAAFWSYTLGISPLALKQLMEFWRDQAE